jgi:type II secretory pathway pseudopilin PulG
MTPHYRTSWNNSPAQHGPPPAARSRQRLVFSGIAGLTLVEVMLAMTVVGSACLAGLASMMMSLRMADSNLRSLQAASAVRSVAEQLLAVDYLSLFEDELHVDVPSNPNGSLIPNTADWNVRTMDLRHTPDNPNDDLQLRLRPYVTHVTQTDGLDYAQIVIAYEWTDSSFFVPRTRSDSFTMLVAPISSF